MSRFFINLSIENISVATASHFWFRSKIRWARTKSIKSKIEKPKLQHWDQPSNKQKLPLQWKFPTASFIQSPACRHSSKSGHGSCPSQFLAKHNFTTEVVGKSSIKMSLMEVHTAGSQKNWKNGTPWHNYLILWIFVNKLPWWIPWRMHPMEWPSSLMRFVAAQGQHANRGSATDGRGFESRFIILRN